MQVDPRLRSKSSWTLLRGLVAAACVIIVLAGLRAARGVLVPVFVAVFLSVVTAPLVLWLRRRYVPTPLAVVVVVLGVLALVGSLAVYVGTSLTDFARGIPLYQVVLEQRYLEIVAMLEERGWPVPAFDPVESFDPGAAFGFVALLFNSVRSLITNGFLILLTMVFILLEAAGFEGKLRRALRDPEATFARFKTFAQGVKQYLVIKTAVSLLTGTLVAVWTSLVGLDYPLLWGLLAFLLNFIPTFGSIIAGVPAVLLALVQTGFGLAGMVFVGYLVINVLIGNLVEPRWAGYGVGLSPLVVFLSLLLWGFVLGPVGLLLAVPLTMTVKIGLESSPYTLSAAILLGPEHAPEPEPVAVPEEDEPVVQTTTDG